MTEECSCRSAFFLVCLVVILTSAGASAQLPNQPGLYFPTIQIAAGEGARVIAQNHKADVSEEDSSCGVTLEFVDTGGRVVKQIVVVLRPGQNAALELSWDELRRDAPGAEIHAVLLFGYYGGAPLGPALARRFKCNIVPRLEVFDERTGQMKLILKDAKQLPPPATPAQ